jgi:hypothetical protein
MPAERRARALVRSAPGWRTIEAMAAALVERGTVEKEEAEAIFAGGFGAPPPRFGGWHEHWPPAVKAIRAGELPPDWQRR